MAKQPWLEITRVVRFGDTDAAGVMHFHQLLRWCHEAWEESLEIYGVTPETVFPGSRQGTPEVALPIVHCHADFRAPLFAGDVLQINLTPKRLDPVSFELTAQFHCLNQMAAKGYLRHIAIDAKNRQRCALPADIDRWLEASCIGQIQPL